MSIIIFNEVEELADAAAEMIAALLQDAVRARGEAHLVLSGGGTPRPVYERLGRPPLIAQLPWPSIHFWWADERCVPPASSESNYQLAVDTFLASADPPVTHIHRVRGELSPAAAAEAYTRELGSAASPGRLWPRFDVAILGLGGDGHTASLFPGEIGDEELTRPAIAVTAEYDGRPADRVTITPMVFNAARQVIFLVTGARKADAIAAVFDNANSDAVVPARRIRPAGGEIVWLIDRPAAGKLRES